MPHLPRINTAIPKRRYQLGEFIVTVLGDIESGDGVPYRYILAVARESDPRPGLFLCTESTQGEERAEGELRLRLAMPDGAQVLGYGDRWRALDDFVDEGLALIGRLLDLGDEVPYRLM